MLKQRVITALVLLGIFLPILIWGSIEALAVLFGVIIVLAAWEWWRLLFPAHHSRAYFYAALVLLSLLIFLVLGSNVVILGILWLATLFWLLVVPFLMRQSLDLSLSRWSWPLALAGLFILPACWFALMILRSNGTLFLLSALILVWIADVGAYFTGKKWGKNKLAVRLSPGKSVEGALGGLVLVIILGFGMAYGLNDFSNANFYTWLLGTSGISGTLILLIVFVALSIQGDLFESQIKRLSGVKDSSSLLPGHGGVLDRIDALLPFLPACALLVYYWSRT